MLALQFVYFMLLTLNDVWYFFRNIKKCGETIESLEKDIKENNEALHNIEHVRFKKCQTPKYPICRER